jgi:hypothetical protein
MAERTVISPKTMEIPEELLIEVINLSLDIHK